MISWKELKSEKAVHSIVEISNHVPIAIFKHSTVCEISAMVKERIELQWDIGPDAVDVYCLDIRAHRRVSDEIDRIFGVPHESPQLLLIKEGKSIYNASHADINVDELRSALGIASGEGIPAALAS
ncbi:MAG: bacillithiol system redox-active protein YtxJ [Candidatus Krumholzibacteria bacterium]|nr:bacillithiol system redox-active protein YtxJ [Candidatus Krumholzibacteria bacterium]